MLLAVTPITDRSFCVFPKLERNVENSAELCLSLVHNPFWAVPTPSFVTIGLNWFLLSTIITSNRVVQYHTPYATQNSLCSLRMRLCCPCHPQERVGISGTGSPEEYADKLWWASSFRVSTHVQVEEEQGWSSIAFRQSDACVWGKWKPCVWSSWCQAKPATHWSLSMWAWRRRRFVSLGHQQHWAQAKLTCGGMVQQNLGTPQGLLKLHSRVTWWNSRNWAKIPAHAFALDAFIG